MALALRPWRERALPRPRSRRHPGPGRRLRLERLEDRTLLSNNTPGTAFVPQPAVLSGSAGVGHAAGSLADPHQADPYPRADGTLLTSAQVDRYPFTVAA